MELRSCHGCLDSDLIAQSTTGRSCRPLANVAQMVLVTLRTTVSRRYSLKGSDLNEHIDDQPRYGARDWRRRMNPPIAGLQCHFMEEREYKRASSILSGAVPQKYGMTRIQIGTRNRMEDQLGLVCNTCTDTIADRWQRPNASDQEKLKALHVPSSLRASGRQNGQLGDRQPERTWA